MASGLRQKIAGLGPLERERSVVSIKELVLEAVIRSTNRRTSRCAWRSKTTCPMSTLIPSGHRHPPQPAEQLRRGHAGGGVVTTRAFQPGKGEGSPSYYVLVAVEDTGPGIPLENQAKVFNLFSRREKFGFRPLERPPVRAG
jgi:hypothetical protein